MVLRTFILLILVTGATDLAAQDAWWHGSWKLEDRATIPGSEGWSKGLYAAAGAKSTYTYIIQEDLFKIAKRDDKTKILLSEKISVEVVSENEVVLNMVKDGKVISNPTTLVLKDGKVFMTVTSGDRKVDVPLIKQ